MLLRGPGELSRESGRKEAWAEYGACHDLAFPTMLSHCLGVPFGTFTHYEMHDIRDSLEVDQVVVFEKWEKGAKSRVLSCVLFDLDK